MNLSIPQSIVIAGALIALSILASNRFMISSEQGITWRVDRLTGSVKRCSAHYGCEDAVVDQRK